ncbi:MAG: TIGR03067 domain-containing protein [Bacteroidales bacterium]|nr:TIGR03067 domain-containing protein [Bacteroidales bacterium]
MPSRLLLAAAIFGGLFTIRMVAEGQSPSPVATAAPLGGTWQIVTLIDDGALIPPQSIGDQFVKDARITISGNTLSLSRPGDAEPRKLPFVVNASTTPNTLDLAGADKTGSRGIFLHNGDTLIVCLGGPTSTERPSEFSSKPGSGNVFMTLQRLAAPVANPPKPVPLTPPVEPAPSRDTVFREQLIGTWGHQTDDRVSYTTLNSDGTFSSTLTWKRGFRKMFHGDVRNSGTWKVEDGSFVTQVTASTDSKQQNQIFVSRISSIDGRQAVFIDQDGRPRTEWKVR